MARRILANVPRGSPRRPCPRRLARVRGPTALSDLDPPGAPRDLGQPPVQRIENGAGGPDIPIL